MLQGPGYPYEQVLKQYNNETNLVMCAYLPEFKTFNRTAGMEFFFSLRALPRL